jgi:hypothetical protein
LLTTEASIMPQLLGHFARPLHQERPKNII